MFSRKTFNRTNEVGYLFAIFTFKKYTVRQIIFSHFMSFFPILLSFLQIINNHGYSHGSASIETALERNTTLPHPQKRYPPLRQIISAPQKFCPDLPPPPGPRTQWPNLFIYICLYAR